MVDSPIKRHSCARCGSCCEWFVIANQKGLTVDQRDYMDARSDAKFGDFYMVHAPCRFLIQGTKEDPKAKCEIYKTRPKLCRQYNGKPQFGRQKFAVPPGCAMAYGDNKPSSDSNKQS